MSMLHVLGLLVVVTVICLIFGIWGFVEWWFERRGRIVNPQPMAVRGNWPGREDLWR